MSTEYRTTKNKNEIISLLKSSELESAFAWQTVQEKRLKYSVKSLFFNYPKNEIQFYLIDYNFDLFSDSPIYLKFNKRDILIKADILEIKNNSVIVQTPLEVMVDELRKSPRVQLPLEKRNGITLCLESDITSQSSQSFDFALADISKTGFSIYFPQEKARLFGQTNSFYLTKINGIELSIKLKVSLKYSQTLNQKNNRSCFIKAGFQTQFQISEEFIDQHLFR